MSGLRRIINNTLISLLGQLVTWTSTLGLTIAYGRFLGDIKFGELYFATTFIALVGFPVEFGFNQQLTRDITEEPDKAQAYLWNALLLKFVLWMLAYTGVLLVSKGLGESQEQWTLIIICGISLLSGSIVNTFAALHYAFERTVFPSVGMMIEKGFSALVGFLLLKNGASVETMALVLLGGSLLDALWVAIWCFRLTGVHIALQKTLLLKLMRGSIPFMTYGVLGVIYYRIDTILLSFMTSAAVVGWYGAGYRLFDTLLFIPNLILNAVMYPVFAKLANKSQSALRMAVEKCMNLLLICAIPIAGFMIAAAPNIIGFLYHSSDFLNAIPVLEGLAPGLVFLYINTLFSSVIVSTRGEKKIPLMAAAALIFNLSLNLFLIPRYQQVGAAVVTSLTELLLLGISATFIPRYLLPRKSVKVAVKTLAAGLIMATAVFFLRTLSVFLLLPIGTVVYIASATLLRTIPRADLQSLLAAVKHKRGETPTGTLENIAEENIYLQITDPHLPAISPRRAQFDLSDVIDDDVTELLPAVRLKKALAARKVTTNLSIDGDVTELLPAVRSPKSNRGKNLQEENLQLEGSEL